uniref:Uncharacterized protein n=1 Tax=Arundo donax TaxID=35708 RepID=A0A0A9F034_ARUDO
MFVLFDCPCCLKFGIFSIIYHIPNYRGFFLL